MELSFRVTRALHDDHMAVVALLRTVSTALGGAGREIAPSANISADIDPGPAIDHDPGPAIDHGHGPGPAPKPRPAPASTAAPMDSRLAGILVQLAGAVEGEVGAHFALEEDGLFPLLEAAGEGDLGRLLSEEHAIILPLGRRVAGLARAGARDGFDAAGWREIRRLGLEFAGLLTAHAEKEEMGLLPVLEEILTADDDRRLADAYQAGLPIGPATAPAAPDTAIPGEAVR